jgi:L-aminopeptidase/D-esterase-like protein
MDGAPTFDAIQGADSILDVGGLRVGHWTSRRAATGCTVILAPAEGAVAAVDVRGGAPGTRETDLLAPGRTVRRVHAVLLSGGSAYGLDAATGVMRFLEERGIGWKMRSAIVPIVTAAVIYDLGVSDAHTRPDAESGYRASRLASSHALKQGSVGAGTGATVAKILGASQSVKGGIGSASERLSGGLIVGALAVVNAVGEIVNPDSGEVVAGCRQRPGDSIEPMESLRARPGSLPEQGGNTTLAVVATNAALDSSDALRLATMAHGGIARTIRPSHTPADGDTVFALSVGRIDVVAADLLPICALATRALERAILRAVLNADGLAGVPSAVESNPVTRDSA